MAWCTSKELLKLISYIFSFFFAIFGISLIIISVYISRKDIVRATEADGLIFIYGTSFGALLIILCGTNWFATTRENRCFTLIVILFSLQMIIVIAVVIVSLSVLWAISEQMIIKFKKEIDKMCKGSDNSMATELLKLYPTDVCNEKSMQVFNYCGIYLSGTNYCGNDVKMQACSSIRKQYVYKGYEPE